jgi:hypothetical protein
MNKSMATRRRDVEPCKFAQAVIYWVGVPVAAFCAVLILAGTADLIAGLLR